MQELRTYGPNRAIGLVSGSVLVGTAGILAWLGTILSQADLEAMDGFQRLFFSLVPIRPFSWVMAAVFGFFGARVALRGWRGKPSLVISENGFSLGTGELHPWGQFHEATCTKGDRLVLEFFPRRSLPRVAAGRHRQRPAPTKVTLSQFDLGENPKAVAEAIEGITKRDNQ